MCGESVTLAITLVPGILHRTSHPRGLKALEMVPAGYMKVSHLILYVINMYIHI